MVRKKLVINNIEKAFSAILPTYLLGSQQLAFFSLFHPIHRENQYPETNQKARHMSEAQLVAHS